MKKGYNSSGGGGWQGSYLPSSSSRMLLPATLFLNSDIRYFVYSNMMMMTRGAGIHDLASDVTGEGSGTSSRARVFLKDMHGAGTTPPTADGLGRILGPSSRARFFLRGMWRAVQPGCGGHCGGPDTVGSTPMAQHSSNCLGTVPVNSGWRATQSVPSFLAPRHTLHSAPPAHRLDLQSDTRQSQNNSKSGGPLFQRAVRVLRVRSLCSCVHCTTRSPECQQQFHNIAAQSRLCAET